MSLKEQIQKDITKALKAKKTEIVSTLRYLFAQIRDEEINQGRRQLKDKEIVKIIQQQLKKLNESLDSFKLASRQDLIDQAIKEIKVLKTYLPEQLSDAQLKAQIDKFIKENKDIKNPGQLIGKAIVKLGDKADNKKISELILTKVKK
jgi:uncharacterized protein